MNKKGTITTSWDDGFWLDVKLAGLLDKYSLKGTFYISKKFLKKPLLKKNEIREIAKRHEIGAHSLIHKDLTRLNTQELKKEVEGSKAYLEDIIQKEVKMFAYPLGRFNSKVKKAVKSAKFLGARTTSKLNSKLGDPFEFGISLGSNTIKMPLENWLWMASISAKDSIKSKAIWHLAGHTWQIEHFGMWEILERLFEYLQRLKNKICLVNSAVIQK